MQIPYISKVLTAFLGLIGSDTTTTLNSNSPAISASAAGVITSAIPQLPQIPEVPGRPHFPDSECNDCEFPAVQSIGPDGRCHCVARQSAVTVDVVAQTASATATVTDSPDPEGRAALRNEL